VKHCSRQWLFYLPGTGGEKGELVALLRFSTGLDSETVEVLTYWYGLQYGKAKLRNRVDFVKRS